MIAPAYLATALLALVILLQLLLVAGLPLGHLAWGGEHRVLPTKLRLGSLAAIVILLFAGWVVLARVGVIEAGGFAKTARIATWVFAAYFALNSLGNLVSKSRFERIVMTPVALALMTCFALVALMA